MSAARGWDENAREKEKKGGTAIARVSRYRPGQKPAWLNETDGSSGSDGEGHDDGPEALLRTQKAGYQKMSINVTGQQRPGPSSRSRERRVITPAVVAKKKDAGQDGKDGRDRGEGGERRPQRHREVITVPADAQAKRAALKQRLMEEKEAAASKKAAQINGSNDSDGSDDSDDGDESDDIDDSDEDYTSDSSDGDDDLPIARPVFVRKQDRQTLAEREAIEREELEKIEKEKIRAAKQAQESRKIAQEKIAAELALEAAARAGPQGAEDVVTDDEADPEGDHARWKEREMARLRRAFTQVLRDAQEEKERQAWAGLSDREKEKYLADKTRAARSDARIKAEEKARDRKERELKGQDVKAAQGRVQKGAFFRE